MTYQCFPVPSQELTPEDAKIVRLARAARQRAYVRPGGQSQGAAVRDTDGRTYAAANVEHVDPSLTVTALAGALSAAFSSGARTFEALVCIGPTPELSVRDQALVGQWAPDVPILLADVDGSVCAVVSMPGAGSGADS